MTICQDVTKSVISVFAFTKIINIMIWLPEI